MRGRKDELPIEREDEEVRQTMNWLRAKYKDRIDEFEKHKYVIEQLDDTEELPEYDERVIDSSKHYFLYEGVLSCWLDWLGYPKYFVTVEGKVYSRHTGQTVEKKKQIAKQSNVYMVFLTHNNKGQQYRVHKLVANCFVEKSDITFNGINFIDGDIHNCRADNLEWSRQNNYYRMRLKNKQS